jgi:hypothetical protein
MPFIFCFSFCRLIFFDVAAIDAIFISAIDFHFHSIDAIAAERA